VSEGREGGGDGGVKEGKREQGREGGGRLAQRMRLHHPYG